MKCDPHACSPPDVPKLSSHFPLRRDQIEKRRNNPLPPTPPPSRKQSRDLCAEDYYRIYKSQCNSNKGILPTTIESTKTAPPPPPAKKEGEEVAKGQSGIAER